MYGRRPIVYRKQPTFLQSLLGGVGYGVTQAMQRAMAEKERKRGMAQNVMEMILSGRMPPEVVGTDMFQKYTEASGISDMPEIRKLKFQALEKFRPKAEARILPSGQAVDMPQPIPLDLAKAGLPWEAYKESEKEKQYKLEDEAWKRAFDRKLKEYKITDKFKSELARENMLINMVAAQVEAKKAGYEIENINNIDWANGTFKVDYLLPAEKTEKKEKSAAKNADIWKKDYATYKANGNSKRLRRTKLLMDLAKVKAGITSGSPAIQAILDSYNVKSGDPDKIWSILYREANKEIDQYNKIEAEDAKRLKLKPDQRIQLKRIAPGLEDVEPKPALTLTDTRSGVNLPPPQDEGIDSSEVVEGEPTIINAAGERMVVRGGKWVKVKKIS